MQLSAEENFIINCLRLELGEEKYVEPIKFDSSALDWNLVLGKAMQMRVASLLYKAISRRSSGQQFSNIPDLFSKNIKIEYARTQISNQLNYEYLVKIIEEFNAEGIKVVLLKGIHLAQFLYQDVGLRPMSDVDILINIKKAPEAEKILFEMGYEYIQKQHDDKQHDCIIQKLQKDFCHFPPFGHKKSGVKTLEVHWLIEEPHRPFNIDMEKLWKKALSVKINGIEVLLLSPEDLLLHLSIHTSYNHKFKDHGLLPLCDMTIVLKHYAQTIDWERLKREAKEWKAEKHLYLMLRLSREILGASVSDDVLQALKPDGFSEHIFLEAEKRVISIQNEKPTNAKASHLEKFHADISFLEKISYIFKRIFIAPEELAYLHSLPTSSKRVYLYYFVRLYSLLQRDLSYYLSFYFSRLFRKKDDFYNTNLDAWLVL